MMLFTLGPRPVQRLATAWIVFSLVSLSTILALGQDDKKPDAKAAPEKKPPALITDPPLDGRFEILRFDPKLKGKGTEIVKVLTAGEVEKGKEAAFQTYFKEYSLGRWTQPASQTSLPVLRKELRSQLATTFQKGPKAHAFLNALLLQELETIAKGNYAPVVRINAMLMLGDLNSQEPARPGAAAVPLPDALVPLGRAINDEKQIESVKIAALEGLRRHADSGIPEGDTRKALVAALVKLISAPNPLDRLPAGHDWMRAQASDVLGAIGEPGEKGDVATALGQLAGNSKASLAARRAAARALGRLDYAKATGLDTTPLSLALSQLAVDACQRAKRELDSPDSSPTDVHRQLRSLVNAARVGLNGSDDKHKGVIGAAKDSAQQKRAASAAEQVNKLASSLDLRDNDNDKKKDKINTAIEAAVSGLTPLVEKTK